MTLISNIDLSDKQVDNIIDLALSEDLSEGDATSQALIPPDLQGKASIIIVENGVLAGGVIMARVFNKVDPSLEFTQRIEDGTHVIPGDIVGTVSGSMLSILKAERVALNLLQRLSGVATETARYVAEIRGCKGKIYDTRKTTPGLRLLEKYAVKMGGGENHRMHLGDAVLIKDNHIAALRAEGLTLTDIITRIKQKIRGGITIEIEVTTAEEAAEAAQAGVDIIMLDNMSPEEMKKVVDSMPAGTRTEASGNITLENVREAALSGVDIISIGALTHSYKSLDIRIEYES
ncbi:MAG: carboxylating nicotinate-nucleotide diphosphorylase [Dehalococcoidales bacterium]|nr:MAG: carboxylating nicotinate-nucleotide diphosphorylase [Dehalococcoidales bacterium]